MANRERVQPKANEPKAFTHNKGRAPTVIVPANDAHQRTAEASQPRFESFAIAEFDGEPRVKDLDLAERLGFDRPRDIRKLIERNHEEIEGMGTCATVAHVVRGNPVKEFHLNEEQALLVSVLSNATNAAAVRAMLIRTFVAYRQGQLGTPAIPADVTEEIHRILGINKMLSHKVTEMEKAFPLLRSEFMTALLENDPRHIAVIFKPSLEVLKDHDVPTKGRRGFSQKVSNRLRRYSLAHNHPMRESRETGRWLFHVDAISGWLEAEGQILIRNHKAKLAGDGELFRLVKS